MRLPQATTVSAARMNAPGCRGRTASALARASRSTCAAGSSRGSGASSISAGSITSGKMLICRSNSSRRGEAEASTRIGIACLISRLSAQMQHADQREQPPSGVVIDRNLAGEQLDQQCRAFVVQRPAAGVDRLDLAEVMAAHGIVIALADDE